jgi:plasmid stabilization system protein ParE
MYDHPNAVELLAVARDTFLQELMPLLPESSRYSALMLANALAIATREVEAGSGPAQSELESLARLYGEVAEGVHDEQALDEALRAGNRRLAADLRAGRFKGAELAAVREHLLQVTRAKLRVSNPKYLKAQEGVA